jgi:hypothetical protein
MVKSIIKVKKVISNKPASHNKKTLREIIENKIQKYSKKNDQPYVSRLRLFEELHKIHKNKSHNQIKFYLKLTLIKLLDEKVLVKHRNSFRFSKVHLKKNANKLKKLKEKQKQKLEKKQNKTKIQKDKELKSKISNIFSNNSRKASKEIKKIKSNIDQKIKKSPLIKKINITSKTITNPSLNGNAFGFTNIKISSITYQNNKSNEREYKRIHPAIWQYYDNCKDTNSISPDDFYGYNPEASDIVEDAWQKYITHRGLNDVRSVKSGEWEYMVDFMNWEQRNIIHSAHTKRNIRRIDEKGNITRNPYQ